MKYTLSSHVLLVLFCFEVTQNTSAQPVPTIPLPPGIIYALERTENNAPSKDPYHEENWGNEVATKVPKEQRLSVQIGAKPYSGDDWQAPKGSRFHWRMVDTNNACGYAYHLLPEGLTFALKHTDDKLTDQAVKLCAVDPIHANYPPGCRRISGGDIGLHRRNGFYWYVTTGTDFPGWQSEADMWSFLKTLPTRTVLGLTHKRNLPHHEFVWPVWHEELNQFVKTKFDASVEANAPPGFERVFGGDYGDTKMHEGFYWFELMDGFVPDPRNVDCKGVLNGSTLAGSVCQDKKDVLGNWISGTYDALCNCVPIKPMDCLSIPNGPNKPGTPCRQKNSVNFLGLFDADCACVPGVTTTLEFSLTTCNDPTTCTYLGKIIRAPTTTEVSFDEFIALSNPNGFPISVAKANTASTIPSTPVCCTAPWNDGFHPVVMGGQASRADLNFDHPKAKMYGTSTVILMVCSDRPTGGSCPEQLAITALFEKP